MIQIGTNIKQSSTDVLQAIEDSQLVGLIQNQNSDLRSKTERLRKVAAIDKKVYQEIKTSLPYFICASFKDNIRNSENFLEIDKLIIDIDHCLKSPKQSQDLKDLIKEQPGVWLLFVSPSGDGIKIVFKLKSPIQDLKTFKAYYQWFASNFAEKINLIGTLDTRTCDATRVCFMAYDADAYHNQNADMMDWEKWAINHQTADIEKFMSTELQSKTELTPTVYNDLKKMVNPKAIIRKEHHVPAIIDEIKDKIVEAFRVNNLEIEALVPVNYGMKFCVKRFLEKAEVSIYYGKRGFSVVETPKSSVSKALNREVYQIIFNLVFYYHPDVEN